jgi:murein L,D-transpeptidase YcbB/YkuD
VLGLVGGVVGALVIHRSGPDPLGLGVPLVNQSCTGKSLLVTSSGTATPALASAVAEDPDHVHYLEVAHSCATAWKQDGRQAVGYVTYLGPFSSVSQACQLRMTAAHRGDQVTRLHAGNLDVVQCLCYLDFATMPQLREGMDVSVRTGIYVRALQDVLMTMKMLPAADVTGLYDPATVAQVRALQKANALSQNGVVDAATWHTVQNRGCKFYSD